uniref:SOUL heme-binding protein n=1 Tax=Cyanoptyche gloeocystis TaxID=77922 RepID=A0A7S2JLC8_9EUKA|mmetsp:Transcript_1457/g.2757  ORF Transcript_1457/g.2757 Transcript_1457/m.2757 type:complete len:188 (+) Transcript_1457:103-666(+)
MASIIGTISEYTPKYTVIKAAQKYEIRNYPGMILAQTPYDGDDGTSFRTLAKYIFGGNAKKEKMAMTAPVTIAPKSEKIEMTAPVLTGPRCMSFVMPPEYTLETLPTPLDDKVTLTKVDDETLAVIQFSGWAKKELVENKTKELLSALAADGIEPLPNTTPRLAQYNPPWTLPMFRRNEVMMPVPSS